MLHYPWPLYGSLVSFVWPVTCHAGVASLLLLLALPCHLKALLICCWVLFLVFLLSCTVFFFEVKFYLKLEGPSSLSPPSSSTFSTLCSTPYYYEHCEHYYIAITLHTGATGFSNTLPNYSREPLPPKFNFQQLFLARDLLRT